MATPLTKKKKERRLKRQKMLHTYRLSWRVHTLKKCGNLVEKRSINGQFMDFQSNIRHFKTYYLVLLLNSIVPYFFWYSFFEEVIINLIQKLCTCAQKRKLSARYKQKIHTIQVALHEKSKKIYIPFLISTIL